MIGGGIFINTIGGGSAATGTFADLIDFLLRFRRCGRR